MVIDVRTVPIGRSKRQWKSVEFTGDIEWPRLVDGVVCSCEIERVRLELTLTVRFSATVTLSCARCLREFPQAVSGTCIVVARPTERLDEVGYRDDDSQEFWYYEQRPEVDLSQAVFDELMTELPMKPLCSPDCRGIQVRGVVGEEERLDVGAADPRWEALRALRNRNRPASD